MPLSTLSRTLAASLSSNAPVTERTVRDAIAATNGPLTPAAWAEVQALLGSDRFEPSARAQLEAYLCDRPPVALTDPGLPRGDFRYASPSAAELFANGPNVDDVNQGLIGDCYLLATLSAFAHVRPDVIRDAITDNGNGTYTVRFFKREHVSWGRPGNNQVRVEFRPEYVTVDARFPLGGARVKSDSWSAVVEKAYAQWKGGYGRIHHGGLPSQVMSELTGTDASLRVNLFHGEANTFRRLAEALGDGKAVVAATWFKSTTLPNILPWHTYTVTRAYEENGERRVELRNPWGRLEPGRDGVDDGLFSLSLEEFNRTFVATFIDD